MRTRAVPRFSVIVNPGPTVPVSFGRAFGAAPAVGMSTAAAAMSAVQMSFMPEHYVAAAAADSYVTLNDPFIEVKCGSQTNVYVPFFRATITVFVPTKPTVVISLFTPGPFRWKLWMFDLSATVI